MYIEFAAEEEEIDSLIEFIDDQENDLRGKDEAIKRLLGEFRVLSEDTLSMLDPAARDEIVKFRSDIIASLITVVSTTSSIIQKMKRIPKKLGSLLKKVRKFFSYAISLLTKYIKIFKVDSIEITISATPSVVITLKP